jgi:hypothetical protein
MPRLSRSCRPAMRGRQPGRDASTRAVRARAGSESSRVRTASAGAATPRCKGGMRLAGSAAGKDTVSSMMPANTTAYVPRPEIIPPAGLKLDGLRTAINRGRHFSGVWLAPHSSTGATARSFTTLASNPAGWEKKIGVASLKVGGRCARSRSRRRRSCSCRRRSRSCRQLLPWSSAGKPSSRRIATQRGRGAFSGGAGVGGPWAGSGWEAGPCK